MGGGGLWVGNPDTSQSLQKKKTSQPAPMDPLNNNGMQGTKNEEPHHEATMARSSSPVLPPPILTPVSHGAGGPPGPPLHSLLVRFKRCVPWLEASAVKTGFGMQWLRRFAGVGSHRWSGLEAVKQFYFGKNLLFKKKYDLIRISNESFKKSLKFINSQLRVKTQKK